MSNDLCTHCNYSEHVHLGVILRCLGTDRRGNQAETTFTLPQCPKEARLGWGCAFVINHDGECKPERSTHFEAVHGRRVVENDDCKYCDKKFGDHVWVSGQCQ